MHVGYPLCKGTDQLFDLNELDVKIKPICNKI
jgi:hypothetical protein